MIRAESVESRLFLIGGLLVAIGTLLVGLFYGPRYAASFLAGGLLSVVNLAWSRHIVNAALKQGEGRSNWFIVTCYTLRLLLIPLCLYAMMRLLLLGIIAVMAGFAVFYCSVLVEGVFEAFKRGAR
jgi:hypothetical protein